MAQRIGGQNFDVIIGGYSMCVKSASLSITDNTALSTCGGLPDGFVDGDVSASGELEVNMHNFDILNEAARGAGGWRALDTFDLIFFAQVPGKTIEVRASECRLKISDLLSIDPKGGEDSMVKLPFDVTGRDFISVNGVPYLRQDEI